MKAVITSPLKTQLSVTLTSLCFALLFACHAERAEPTRHVEEAEEAEQPESAPQAERTTASQKDSSSDAPVTPPPQTPQTPLPPPPAPSVSSTLSVKAEAQAEAPLFDLAAVSARDGDALSGLVGSTSSGVGSGVGSNGAGKGAPFGLSGMGMGGVGVGGGGVASPQTSSRGAEREPSRRSSGKGRSSGEIKAKAAETAKKTAQPHRSLRRSRRRRSEYAKHTDLPWSAIQKVNQLRHQQHGPARLLSNAPVSTFSMDADSTSYARLRSAIQYGQLLNAHEVKLEGFVNAFPYELTPPPASSDLPLSVTVEASEGPWNMEWKSSQAGGDTLLRIALKGHEVSKEEGRAPSNLVFLVDISGSMRSKDKLPLVKKSLLQLLKQLSERDQVSLVTYSGNVKTLLKPTRADKRGLRRMRRAINRLSAAGSTAGGAGLARAYELAQEGWIEGGNNRVIVATDGDFNVGISSVDEIKRFISERRESGVYLSMFGFGHKNYNDNNMGALARSGNGNYAFIDSLEESERALRVELEGMLSTVATDVKLQVEFNPAHVIAYRLLGYKQRRLAASDFTNDAKDSAELGAGQQVTALYELWTPYHRPIRRTKLNYPCGDRVVGPDVDCPDRKGDEMPSMPDLSVAREWGHLKLRFKREVGASSEEVSYPLESASGPVMEASFDHRVASALALLAERLRSTPYHPRYTRRLSNHYLRDNTLVRRTPYRLRSLERLITPQEGEEVGAQQREALKGLRALMKGAYKVIDRVTR